MHEVKIERVWEEEGGDKGKNGNFLDSHSTRADVGLSGIGGRLSVFGVFHDFSVASETF